MNSYETTVERFWKLFDKEDFKRACELMKPDIVVFWPNTQEIIRGRKNFILIQKKYPGSWKIHLEKILSLDNQVISVVKVFSEDESISHYACSFFTFKDGLISELTEYWGEVTKTPEWRKKEGLSENFGGHIDLH